MAFDVARFGHPFAVLLVVVPPKRKRVDVEVVAVDVELKLFNPLQEQFRQMLARRRIVQLVEPAVLAAKDEFRILGRYLRIDRDPFRLEPQDELQAHLFERRSEFFDPVRKVVDVGIPVPYSVREPEREPRRVEPIGRAAVRFTLSPTRSATRISPSPGVCDSNDRSTAR